MNRLFILTITVMLTWINGFGQIEKINLPESKTVGEIKSLGAFVADLKYYTTSNDTTYTLMFRNLKYQTLTDIKSVSFDGKGGTLESLYNILVESLDAEKGKDNAFKLGKEDIIVKTQSMMGAKYIMFWVAESGAYFNLTKKQLDKLFGK